MCIRREFDLDHIQELDRVCFPTDAVLAEDHLLEALWWVDGDAGYVGLWLPNDKEATLIRYGVDERYQCKGLGRKLAAHALRHARKRRLKRVSTYVLTHNIPSLRCLLSVGFKPYRLEGNSLHLEVLL